MFFVCSGSRRGRRRGAKLRGRRRKNYSGKCFDAGFTVIHALAEQTAVFCAAGSALSRGPAPPCLPARLHKPARLASGGACLVSRLREPFGLASRLRQPAALRLCYGRRLPSRASEPCRSPRRPRNPAVSSATGEPARRFRLFIYFVDIRIFKPFIETPKLGISTGKKINRPQCLLM